MGGISMSRFIVSMLLVVGVTALCRAEDPVPSNGKAVFGKYAYGPIYRNFYKSYSKDFEKSFMDAIGPKTGKDERTTMRPSENMTYECCNRVWNMVFEYHFKYLSPEEKHALLLNIEDDRWIAGERYPNELSHIMSEVRNRVTGKYILAGKHLEPIYLPPPK